jgi:hypothetical protein
MAKTQILGKIKIFEGEISPFRSIPGYLYIF